LVDAATLLIFGTMHEVLWLLVYDGVHLVQLPLFDGARENEALRWFKRSYILLPKRSFKTHHALCTCVQTPGTDCEELAFESWFFFATVAISVGRTEASLPHFHSNFQPSMRTSNLPSHRNMLIGEETRRSLCHCE
jgi:hypothetical protein